MISVSSKYTFDDTGIRAITSAVAKLNAARVRVGVLGADGEAQHPTSDLKVWQVAAIQEFGTQTNDHIPERSFIRRTLNDLVWLRTIIFRAAQRVISGKDNSEGALGWLGQVIVTAIKNTIAIEVPPPNTEATVEWKGHSHTLIGKTGTMADAVTHEVVQGGIIDES